MKQKPTTTEVKSVRKPRGFAAMDKKLVLKIARMGGIAISKDRARMRFLGAIGGSAPRKAKKAA